jgi:hypothetical protein
MCQIPMRFDNDTPDHEIGKCSVIGGKFEQAIGTLVGSDVLRAKGVEKQR